ncbi:InlB B-repeat-containing protein, partial [[Clostridium] innocuum]|uniref:InlB B-repeat-containing protein n=1 Tax=Clostridium innocuum TaxID=1522 RepID=UPI003A4C65E9
MRVSPSGGGTTSPAAGSYMVKQGSREIVSASPASGYRFDRWSDGGSQSHEVLWDLGKTLTAYFTRIETTKYTVVLLASPASGGTTSGSGTFEAGTVRTVSATANPGYRFIRWSDGKAQSHSVTW